MKNILITGASGYIGQHLISYLKEKKLNVIGFSRSNKPNYLDNVQWYCGDIKNIDDLKKAMIDTDGVVHLACSCLNQSFKDPISDFKVNALGTLNVLEASRTLGIKKVVYTSTSQIYSKKSVLPIDENQLAEPETPYAASKLTGEIYCKLYSENYDLNVLILRLFNVYGNSIPSIKKQTVESIFIDKIKQGLPPVINNSNDSRDFIYIEDVVEAIFLALQADLKYEVINIGSGVETSIENLAQIIKKLLRSNIEIIEQSSPKTSFRLQANITNAMKLLNFEPKIDLETGIKNIALQIY